MKEYKPSFLFQNAHINTCFPTLFRKVKIRYRRQRVLVGKDDFLDLTGCEEEILKLFFFVMVWKEVQKVTI
ncbi:Uncharacterised protein [Fusobacterium necrophorum subsp. necrophorum]|nr:Uncharacterised protein [Fusobacterium necrophorum subsp. necrophorum]